MRANGGFAGSYATVIARSEATKQPPLLSFLPKPILEFSFQDIYVPNGQLAGHVTPPEPIQQAFGHGTWELANADWEPDFPTSATNIRWFLEKGKEINPDILAIINLSTVKKILNQIGSFPVPEYDANLTPDNLYLFLQGKTETNFFPGSTQKRDTLTAVGQALIKKTKSLPLTKRIQITHILYTDLINQNIMIHSSNSSLQDVLGQKKLAGILSPEAFDTYSLIETNLGANKANQFVTRQTSHAISSVAEKSSSIHHIVTLHFINSSPAANPNPPVHYGGNYITYLRFYIPLEAKNISLTRNPLSLPPLPSAPSSAELRTENRELKSIYGLTELGFWHTTLAGGESTISLSYDLPLPTSCVITTQTSSDIGDLRSEISRCGYTLAILKQHGLISSQQSINLFGKPFITDLRHSFYYP